MRKPASLAPSFRRAAAPPAGGFAPGELEWIERCGLENLKGRVATADTLAKEAATTLSLLLAGTGGALAYALKLLSGEITQASIAAAAACVWLTGLSCFLILGCLMLRGIPAVYSQPGPLLKRQLAGASWEEWRQGELENIEERIQAAVKRNRSVARRLNWARALAALTPVVALLAVTASLYR